MLNLYNSRFLTDAEINKVNKLQDGAKLNVKVSIDDVCHIVVGILVSGWDIKGL